MRKTLLPAAVIAAFCSFIACKKSDNDNVSNAKTTQNIAGTYSLTGLTWSSLGVTENVYDSLPACEKDNAFEFDADGSAREIDAKVVCDPPETDTLAVWSLSPMGDSLYLDKVPYLIKSWDGKTLVLTGIVDPGPPVVTGMTTFVKQ